jgi:2-amino-4-hydroxy-6-hydroxymethyldihydropteridine diphosphokinase
MILVGLGGNLPSAAGSPQETLAEALRRLELRGVSVLARSSWYRTAPVPASEQPWFANAVAAVATDLPPERLLALLQEVEAGLERVRGPRNAARTCDLDLLAYGTRISGPGESPVLPHPRLHERGFVLRPLRDVAPGWRHPVSGLSVDALIAALSPNQRVEKAPDPG